jgi:serine/threonine protein kinase
MSFELSAAESPAMSAGPQDAKGIFLAALDIPDAAERAAFLERSCGGNLALRQRVDELLRAYGQPDGPLDKLAAALATTEMAEPIGERVGDVIAGKYKLLEALGQGGMGAVFMAQQTQPVKRVVALKLIKLGMDSKQVLARFEAERQALALMDHPNIAKVLDAGATDSGRPFFVMELVKGVPITRFCDERQLSPRQRLELFIPVCQAIQHAHQKGIIHRDIKPTNVLVALYDDRPVPKVIDFGVAKAAGLQLTDASLVTGFGAIVGTPEYMSPEQAQLNQLDIDTRSDVYALGVLLYELLTGTTPLDRKRLGQGALFEVLRIIREEEPPRPSTRLSTSEALASIAATRATEPSKLAKLMRGELDWIVMKCLEKDRSRRYETANGLAHDLERYLADEPVEACPPSSTYRLRKLAGKYKKSLATAAAFAVLLVAGIIVSSWLAIIANRAKHSAIVAESNERAQRESAEIERNRALEAEGKEREQRKATETERDRAERELANGLLRPIGFAGASERDPAELRSFVDWSAIKESSLKLRVLEIALENPETALRVARRAERVIQSCVGMSPTRRAQAIKLVSTKQRDLAADPRIRIAGCWLALELGSTDLPAWGESCDYFSDPNKISSFLFNEFVTFATNRSDPQQVAQLSLEPFLAMLETSTDGNVLRTLCGVLPGLAPRLKRAQAARTLNALFAILEKSSDHNVRIAASQVLAALAPRLEPAQVTRTADALITILEKSKIAEVPVVASNALTALAPRLEPAQVTRTAEALLTILQQSQNPGVPNAASEGLVALAPRLEPAQVTRTADALMAILQKSKVAQVPDEALASWAFSYHPEQRTRAASRPLAALAPRLEPAQVKRAWDGLMAILEKSKNRVVREAVSDVLDVLVPRLEAAQTKRAWDALIAILEKSEDPDLRRAASNAWAALAPRLERAQVTRTADALIEVLEKSENNRRLDWQSTVLVALAPRLDRSQLNRAWDALIAILEKSKDGPIGDAPSNALAALARRLEPSQAKGAFVAILEKSKGGYVCYATSNGLVALAPRLQLASQDNLLTKATALLLDYAALLGPQYDDLSGEFYPFAQAILIARKIPSPRSLASLLSHPGCVAEPRQRLLDRFEELVFYDGKPVFLKPEGADGNQPAHEQAPARRFRNLHDAAAWIQKNWPDFDLETNCPVTWRGSR